MAINSNQQSKKNKINEVYRNKISQCINIAELRLVIDWIYNDSRGHISVGTASSRWLHFLQYYVVCPAFHNLLVKLMEPNMKTSGNPYSYVPFNMNDNEKQFMNYVHSGGLFCTRDKRHAGQSIITSIESSPPPTDFDFLPCYTTEYLQGLFSRNTKRVEGKTKAKNINNLRIYLDENAKLVQEKFKIYTWPDDPDKNPERSPVRTARPHKNSQNIFFVFKIVNKNNNE